MNWFSEWFNDKNGFGTTYYHTLVTPFTEFSNNLINSGEFTFILYRTYYFNGCEVITYSKEAHRDNVISNAVLFLNESVE